MAKSDLQRWDKKVTLYQVGQKWWTINTIYLPSFTVHTYLFTMCISQCEKIPSPIIANMKGKSKNRIDSAILLKTSLWWWKSDPLNSCWWPIPKTAVLVKGNALICKTIIFAVYLPSCCIWWTRTLFENKPPFFLRTADSMQVFECHRRTRKPPPLTGHAGCWNSIWGMPLHALTNRPQLNFSILFSDGFQVPWWVFFSNIHKFHSPPFSLPPPQKKKKQKHLGLIHVYWSLEDLRSFLRKTHQKKANRTWLPDPQTEVLRFRPSRKPRPMATLSRPKHHRRPGWTPASIFVKT